jgi:hypothetical protein
MTAHRPLRKIRRLMMKMHIQPRCLHPLETALPVVSQPVVIERATGVLRVIDGRVWVTQRGDNRDCVLGVHDRLRLVDARRVVIESWTPGEPATIDWTPQHSALDRLTVMVMSMVQRSTGRVGRRSRSCTIDRCPTNPTRPSTIRMPTFGAS